MKTDERFDGRYYFAIFAVGLTLAAFHLGALADTMYLWTDELFSWWVGVQTSWTGLWQAMYRGSDGMFPAFYILAWGWSRIFGQSEIALRLPGILFMLTGATVCFALIRRLWGGAVACASVCTLVLGNGLLLNQTAQFRGYGMLLGLTALSVYTLAEITPDHPRRRRWLWAHAVIQLLLCLTHPFGVVYATALGSAKVLANATATPRFWDRGLAWSYGPALFGLLVWVPGIRAVSRLNLPHGWVPPVTANDLTNELVPRLDSPWGLAAVFIAVVIMGLGKACAREVSPAEAPLDPQRRTAILLAVAILAVAPLAWGISLVVEPLFVARYFVPAAWGWAILGAACCASALRAVARPWHLAFAAAPLVFGSLGLLFLHYPQLGDRSSQKKPLVARLMLERVYAIGEIDRFFLREKIPVFVESIHYFLPRVHYNPGKYDYRLLINRQAALEQHDVRGASIDINLIFKVRENGLAPEKILDVRDAWPVLDALPAFYVIDAGDRPTVDSLLAELRSRGWAEEIVCKDLAHPSGDMAFIRKFTRPRAPESRGDAR